MITPTGDIKNLTIPWLFQDLRAEKKTGTVTLTRAAEVKKVFFRTGEIIYASSNQDADQFGVFLLNAGKITLEQHTSALEASRGSGKPMAAVLVERGAMVPKELVESAKQHVTNIILGILSWSEGRYAVDHQPLPLTDIVPLPLSTGKLLQSALQAADWKVVRKSLPPLKTALAQAKDSGSLLQGIELDQDQQTILSFVNGSRTIEEICSLSELGDFITLKALYLLYALRLAQQTTAKAADRTAPAASTAEEEQQDVKVTKEMILHALESLAIQDYYQMLDVGRSATPQEIKKAYFRCAKLYHPDRHIDSELAEMKDKLETLFMNMTEAYNVLSKEETREKYNISLVRGVRRQQTHDQAPAQRQDTQKANAASQFAEGMKQFRVQNFWGAEEAFSWAVRLDPSNADYVFHQGLAMARIPRRMHDAEELFKEAIKMAPSKIDYHLELGNFYVKNGLKAKALAAFKDALLRDPNSEKIKQAIKSVGGQP